MVVSEVGSLVLVESVPARLEMSRPCATPCDGSPEAVPFGADLLSYAVFKVRKVGIFSLPSYSITSLDQLVEYHTIRNVTAKKRGGGVAKSAGRIDLRVPAIYIRTTAFM